MKHTITYRGSRWYPVTMKVCPECKGKCGWMREDFSQWNTTGGRKTWVPCPRCGGQGCVVAT
jgi:DnaJ-class molecular chaperone